MKSLQCESRAVDDVVHHKPKVLTTTTTPRSNPKNHHHLIPNSGGYRNSVQSLKDVVEMTKQAKPRKLKSPPAESPQPPQTPPAKDAKRSLPRKPEPDSHQPATRGRPSSSRISRSAESFFPALTELPEGHPSRNVVEIIFHTSWSPKAFSGRIEMVFKVQNLPRPVTRFEEYREVAKSRAGAAGGLGVNGGGEDHARCVADGNEVMRFYCLGPTSNSGGGGACGYAWGFVVVNGAAMCTLCEIGGEH
mgnify:CR=1 FL=1